MNLDELLKTAVQYPSERSFFLQTLIRSDIYVICKNPVQLEQNKQTARMELVTVRSSDNHSFVPFFTSYHNLQLFVQRYAECYKMNCLRFFELIQDKNAVLNPNSYGKEFSSSEIQLVLRIAETQHIQIPAYDEYEMIDYRKPQYPTEHITKSVSKFFSSQPNVEEAFLVEMQKESEKPRLLIVVDMLGNTRKLFVELARHLAKDRKTANEHFYFLSYEQPLAKKAVAGIEPFYVRSTKRYFQR